MAEYRAFQYTLDTARTRLLQLEHDIANAPSAAELTAHVGAASDVVRSTALGRDEGPALVEAAQELDRTAGRRGVATDVPAAAREQSMLAAWGAFVSDPFAHETASDMSGDIAYTAHGSRVYSTDLTTMTEDERRRDVAESAARIDSWARDRGVQGALSGAAGTVARYDGYAEAADLVAEARTIYELARTAPGAFADLPSIDEVLEEAKRNNGEVVDDAGASTARDRIRENFAVQRDGVAPAGKDELARRMTAAFQVGLQERQDRAERGATSLDVVQARTADRVRDITLAQNTAERLFETIPNPNLGEPDTAVSGREAADLETMARLHGKWADADPTIANRVDLVDALLTEAESRPSISDADVASHDGFDKRGWQGWEDVERKELLNNTSEQKVLLQAMSGQQPSASYPRSAAAELNASMGQAQPAPTFRSGRGFGAATKDAGVER